MSQIWKQTYTFDDLLLLPVKSEILPSQVNISVKLTPKIILKSPFVAACMDTVTEKAMAIAAAQNGGLGIIHKNLTINEQAKQVFAVKKTKVDLKKFPNATLDVSGKLICGAAIGVTLDMMKRVSALVAAKVDILALDTAHGNSQGVIAAVKSLKKCYPDLEIIAGNIVTADAVKNLAQVGAEVIKVGIGPGSVCTTRIVAGVGMPQISAIMDCAQMAIKEKVTIIADGGIKHSGDVVKALAAGATGVMIGSMFAGTKETPGKLIILKGKKYKSYRGMASLGAMSDGSADRYFQSGNKKFVPEGVEGLVPYKGPVGEIIFQINGGIRAGMGYLGAKNHQKLIKNAKFVVQTSAGYYESHPSIQIMEKALNYKGKK